MAKQVITMLLDDLDGGEAEETVSFAFDGNAYQIDLSGKNAADFRKVMDRYLQAATRVGRVGAGAQLIPTRPTRGVAHPNFVANKELNAQIRQWASANGYDLAERGRISQHVVDAYHSRTSAASVQPELTAPEPPKKSTRARKAAPAAKFSNSKSKAGA